MFENLNPATPDQASQEDFVSWRLLEGVAMPQPLRVERNTWGNQLWTQAINIVRVPSELPRWRDLYQASSYTPMVVKVFVFH